MTFGIADNPDAALDLATAVKIMFDGMISGMFTGKKLGDYFRVGIAPSGPPRPHHAPEFEMHEGGLPVGLRVGLNVMLSALQEV